MADHVEIWESFAIANARSTRAAAQRTAGCIAPLWPLKDFVAVNPFLGLVGSPFVKAAQTMACVAGARMTMPRSFYAQALACRRMTDADLSAALERTQGSHGLPASVDALKQLLWSAEDTYVEPIATVADLASRVTGRDWAGFAVARISTWAAAHFDVGQAAWKPGSRVLPEYASWRDEARIDRTPAVMGLASFRKTIESLPDAAEAMIEEGVRRLGLPAEALEAYFHRLLMSVAGWAGYARYQTWQCELQGSTDQSVIELLAIRLAWDVALLESLVADPAVGHAWARARAGFDCQAGANDSVFAAEAVLQEAYEIAWQRTLVNALDAMSPSVPPPVVSPPVASRASVQAAFCIDVRSEVFRRAFEAAGNGIETLGFAGFFGVAMNHVPLGQRNGSAQCPVLLAPRFTIRDSVQGAQRDELAGILRLQLVRRRIVSAWRAFRTAAVASFAFVETMGWTYAMKLASDALGLRRALPQPATDGVDAAIRHTLAPDIAPSQSHGQAIGIVLEERIALAESILRGMSLTSGFARLVLLVGHGATTVNNPHASGLDCGACGGHPGDANARVAAAILNDVQVRAALADRGIKIPADCVFVGCLHDTTTDVVTVFDQSLLPASHTADLQQLQQWLKLAGRAANSERAALLHVDAGKPLDAQLLARTRDWSQVRPEWGLAGCAAFIAAPRSRTESLDLQGRAFLHTYDWRQDDGFGVLELIMTAPMVVASWINLQYYGSTVDNRVFGCGNKVLHNVVGTLGVLEGNGGDLRSGLPWQSLHDGERLIHEPMRLSVVINAPLAAIEAVIAKHASVRQLVDNGWLHLFAMGDPGVPLQRYCGQQRWDPV
ncbi:MAG: YbcC family protein [Thermomonas sp.]